MKAGSDERLSRQNTARLKTTIERDQRYILPAENVNEQVEKP